MLEAKVFDGVLEAMVFDGVLEAMVVLPASLPACLDLCHNLPPPSHASFCVCV